jgi:hypothetical protein
MFLAHFSHFGYTDLMNMSFAELEIWYCAAVNSHNHLNAQSS